MRGGAVLLAVLLGALGCSEKAGTDAAPQAEPAAAQPAQAPRRPPALGEFSLEVAGDRVSIRCGETLAAEVLERLATAAGFALTPGPRPTALVRLDLEDVRTEEVLGHLLAGQQYSVEYESDAARTPRIVRVRVAGAVADLPPAVERKLKVAKVRPREPIAEKSPREERREPPRRWTPEDEEALEADLTNRLESRDSEVRADALTELDTDAPGMERLAVLALEDPESSVRLAAIEHLEGEDGFGAINVLIKALEDDDPAVVARAVEAIGTLGDESLLPMIVPLQDHRDARVREAVGEAVEFLE
jgi:hypothetical protein